MSEQEIYIEAMNRPDPAERRHFLDEACGGDGILRERVEKLILRSDQLGSFLEHPIIGATQLFDETTGTRDNSDSAEDVPLDFLESSEQPDSLGRLGRYEILEVVGRGGMGIVLKALDTDLQRIVAVKVLAPELAANAIARKRFLREAQAAAAVNHNYVVTIYAVEENGGRADCGSSKPGSLPFLVMEFIDGQSLQEKIDQQGPLELKAILRIGRQMASGLAAAHHQGLIHRDIKPANILLQNGVQRVQITDFGLARAVDDVGMTRTGEVSGTPVYMSPEQAMGQPVDARSDLFSLGSVLYAMCTGRAPFRAETTIAVLRRVCDETPRPIREVNPEIPEWLAALITRLLEKNPDQRFQSAAEVADLLRKHLANTQAPGSTSRLDPTLTAGHPTKSRGRRKVLMVALILVVLAASFGVTEATGVTNLSATVVRIVTGEGTLVIEVDDPTVEISLDGEELSIKGAGIQELKLRPGKYQFQAKRDGQPFKSELVSIKRGNREVVRVTRERMRIQPSLTVITDERAFVVMNRTGADVSQFETLAEAVEGASDGDIIEVRGNGPFVSDGVTIVRPLVIRAGEGYTPSITLSQDAADKNISLLTTSVSLVVEGLELRRMGGAKGEFEGRYPCLISAWGKGALHVSNCRFVFDAPDDWTGAILVSQFPVCTIRNCQFLTDTRNVVSWWCPLEGRTTIENCVSSVAVLMELALRGPEFTDISVRVHRNTTVGKCLAIGFDQARKPAGDPPIHLDFSANLTHCPPGFHLGTILRLDQAYLEPSLSAPEAEAFLAALVSLHEQHNVYMAGTRMLHHCVFQRTAAPLHLESEGKDLAGWKRLWKQSDTDSIEGTVRFQGGDLLQKGLTTLEKLTAEDFRLRPDSAGYRAGKDGKDLGADVDLVGPGSAYERWKKTPEYQQWLKDTGQMKEPAAAQPAPAPFVVLTSKGLRIRPFATLAEAVAAAHDGDIIEVCGNGPFITQPLTIGKTALTIRAADGFRPVIKLSPEAVQADEPLLRTYAALVLEGLELYRAPREDGSGRILVVNRVPLWAVNCRLRSSMAVNNAPICVFRNCELLGEDASLIAMCGSGARALFENCLHRTKGLAIGIGSYDAALHNVSIQVKGSTLVSENKSFWLPLRSPIPSDPPQVSKPVRLEVSGSIFNAPAVLGFDTVLGFDPEQKLREEAALLEPPDAEAALLRLLDWRGERNLFAGDSARVSWSADGKIQPPHGPKGLEEWTQFWGGAEADSLEGRVRFEGGNILSHLGATSEQLTTDDFRLRPGSAGYRAGKDGKDLGADIDLVGPGAAYERWKKTPEYQMWLKEARPVAKAEASKAEPKAFVVLTGKGVEVSKYDTLAEAVQSSSDGDIIEIRGNGPFETDSVSVKSALSIRAGEGFRPRIKLSAKAAEGNQHLFKASARLVLEGLDLYRPQGPTSLINSKASVAAANCRFHVGGGYHIWTGDSCTTRNCLFLGGNLTMNGGPIPDGAKYAMDNCVDMGRPFNLPYPRDDLHVRIQLTHSTIVARGIGIQVGEITDLLPGAKGPKPIRFDSSGNIFGSDLLWFQLTPAFLAKHKGFEPEQSGEALLRSLIDWNEGENLHGPGGPYMTWVMDQALQPSNRVKTLADWQQLWGLAGTGSLEGVAKYQGGDVLAKFATDPDRLTPDDFRLRPDSAGYRAGPDGKDLGADVDLVGPGPAYERWKKTPDYQEWLKATGQKPKQVKGSNQTPTDD